MPEAPRSNLEFKAPHRDLAQARACARALGARPEAVLQQTDHYYQAPSGRLKLRVVPAAPAQLIGYARPEAEVRYSRFRIVEVADAAALDALLADTLGRRVSVIKTREWWSWRECRLHLDEVQQLGAFVEFEVLSAGDRADDAGRLAALLAAFGYTATDGIAGSYVDLLEASARTNSR